MSDVLPPLISVVVIGRNEGPRLLKCIDSIQSSDYPNLEIICVDSASTDGSPECAEALGATLVRLQPELLSAALARNAGWRQAQGDFILFLDGDTVLEPHFITRAIAELENPDVAVVWGHRREIAPEQSLYVRVLDLDWIYPPGDSLFCGGDALMRRSVLEKVGGFDDTLIAGEEPELCRRIRAQGYVIRHIDAPMTKHDLAVNNFSAYWKRAFRAGHAYAELAERFRNSEDPLWLADSRRNYKHALLLLSGLITLPLLPLPAASFLLLSAVALILRSTLRSSWKTSGLSTRFYYALHSHFQQIPILCGQLAYRRNQRCGRQQKLIEYKSS